MQGVGFEMFSLCIDRIGAPWIIARWNGMASEVRELDRTMRTVTEGIQDLWRTWRLLEEKLQLAVIDVLVKWDEQRKTRAASTGPQRTRRSARIAARQTKPYSR